MARRINEVRIPRRVGNYTFQETKTRFYPGQEPSSMKLPSVLLNGRGENNGRVGGVDEVMEYSSIHPCFVSSSRKVPKKPNSMNMRTHKRGYACPIFVPYRQLGEIDLRLGEKGHSHQRNETKRQESSESSIASRILKSQMLFMGQEAGQAIQSSQKHILNTQLGKYRSSQWRRNRIVYTKKAPVYHMFREELLEAHRRVKSSKVGSGRLSLHIKPSEESETFPSSSASIDFVPTTTDEFNSDDEVSDDENESNSYSQSDFDDSRLTANVLKLDFNRNHANNLGSIHLDEEPVEGIELETGDALSQGLSYLPYDSRILAERPLQLLNLEGYQEALNKKIIKTSAKKSGNDPIHLTRQRMENMWRTINLKDVLKFLESDQKIGTLISKAMVKVGKTSRERDRIRAEFNEEFGSDAFVKLIYKEFGKNSKEKSRRKIDILSLFFDAKYAKTNLSQEEKDEKRSRLIKKFEHFAIGDLKKQIHAIAKNAPKDFRLQVRKLIEQRDKIRHSSALSVLHKRAKPKTEDKRKVIKQAVVRMAAKDEGERAAVQRAFIKAFEKNSFLEYVAKEWDNDWQLIKAEKPDLLTLYFTANPSIAPTSYEKKETIRKTLIKELDKFPQTSDLHFEIVQLLKKNVTLESLAYKGTEEDNKQSPTPGLPGEASSRPIEKLREAADGFVQVRSSKDVVLKNTLRILATSRPETLQRKFGQLSKGLHAMNWKDEMELLRLGSEEERLKDHVFLHQQGLWYYSLLRDFLLHKEHAREQNFNGMENFILTFIHKVLSHNHEFDDDRFKMMCDVLKKNDVNSPEVQTIFRLIRKHCPTINMNTVLHNEAATKEMPTTRS